MALDAAVKAQIVKDYQQSVSPEVQRLAHSEY